MRKFLPVNVLTVRHALASWATQHTTACLDTCTILVTSTHEGEFRLLHVVNMKVVYHTK